MGYSLAVFDFRGCGMSDGDYTTMGYEESKDVKVVVQHLKTAWKIDDIGIWGRSMGSVAAILYAFTDPSIIFIVLDSPFSNLKKLALEIAQDKTNIPSIFIKGLFFFVSSKVKTQTNFNIDDMDLQKYISKIFMPAFFITSKQDHVVKC